MVDVIRRRVPDLKEFVASRAFCPDVFLVNTVVARNEVVSGDSDRGVELTSTLIHVLTLMARSRLLITSDWLDAFTLDSNIGKRLTRFNADFEKLKLLPIALARSFSCSLFFLRAHLHAIRRLHLIAICSRDGDGPARIESVLRRSAVPVCVTGPHALKRDARPPGRASCRAARDKGPRRSRRLCRSALCGRGRERPARRA